MLHKLFIFIGAVVSATWFGAHWSTTGAVAAGILGAIVGIAFASGIDEPVSLISAPPRWLLLVVGVTVTGGAFGWLIDRIAHSDGAVVPSSIIAGVIGLILCAGIRPG